MFIYDIICYMLVINVYRLILGFIRFNNLLVVDFFLILMILVVFSGKMYVLE